MEIIKETFLDSVKLLPFLFFTYLIMEIIEHKTSKKSINAISKTKKFGPLLGGLFGLVPQCGFSVSASNLYSARIISLGTLIAVFLSTSDEMLPVLLSNNVALSLIIKILLIKLLVGIIFGFIIDLFLKRKKIETKDIHDICEHEHCHCQESIVKSTIIHTIKTFIVIVFVILLLNLLIDNIGIDNISNLLTNNSIFGPFISSLIGLIPNCAASVVITELYVSNAISFGCLISGLLAGSGIGLLILFKTNKNIKENLLVLTILYLISIFCGLLIDAIGITL